MKELKNQTSIKKPNALLITGYDVRICNNIVQLNDGSWQYDMTIYTKAEYKEVEEQINREKDKKIISLENENINLNDRLKTLETDPPLVHQVTNANTLIDDLSQMMVEISTMSLV